MDVTLRDNKVGELVRRPSVIFKARGKIELCKKNRKRKILGKSKLWKGHHAFLANRFEEIPESALGYRQ